MPYETWLVFWAVQLTGSWHQPHPRSAESGVESPMPTREGSVVELGLWELISRGSAWTAM